MTTFPPSLCQMPMLHSELPYNDMKKVTEINIARDSWENESLLAQKVEPILAWSEQRVTKVASWAIKII